MAAVLVLEPPALAVGGVAGAAGGAGVKNAPWLRRSWGKTGGGLVAAQEGDEERGEVAVVGVPGVSVGFVDGDGPGVGLFLWCGDPEEVVAVVGHPDGEEVFRAVRHGVLAAVEVLRQLPAQPGGHRSGEVDCFLVPVGGGEVEEVAEGAGAVGVDQLLVVGRQGRLEKGFDRVPVCGSRVCRGRHELGEGGEAGHRIPWR
ncbi:hypothetical protein [Streptomyces hydrogenans]